MKKHEIQAEMTHNPLKIKQKTVPNQWKCVLGAFLAQQRVEDGSSTPRIILATPILKPFWQKMSLQGSVFGTPEKSEIGPKPHFWA